MRTGCTICLCSCVKSCAHRRAVSRVPSQRAKFETIAGLLCRVLPDEVPVAATFLTGELRQRQIGVPDMPTMPLAAVARSTWVLFVTSGHIPGREVVQDGPHRLDTEPVAM